MTSAVSEYVRRACPACGSEKRDPGVASEPRGEELPYAELRDRWYGFFADKRFFSYDRCQDCGLLYAPQYFSNDQLGALYASMPANMEEVPAGSLERTQRSYFDVFRKFSSLAGTFTEIGPDTGLFLQHVVDEGTFNRFFLFEPNVDVHAELRSRLGDRAHTLSTELLDFHEVPDASVDAVVLIHVLDHLLDPSSYLSALRTKLRPGAIVFTVTHDESSLLARLTKARWPAYCLQHPHLFNPRSVREMFARHGYTVRETIKSTNYFPISYLAEHALMAVGAGKRELPKIPLAVPLQLGNFITIAQPVF